MSGLHGRQLDGAVAAFDPRRIKKQVFADSGGGLGCRSVDVSPQYVYTQRRRSSWDFVDEQEASSPPSAKRVGVREFRGNFSDYMRQVRRGASFIVTSREEVIAIVQPPRPPARPLRQAGGLRGRIWMASDFDTLPTEILACMEGGEG